VVCNNSIAPQTRYFKLGLPYSRPCHPPKKTKIRILVRLLLGWFAENARDLPWRRTRDPYAVWVSEIMLQDMVGQAVDSDGSIF
jgi:hypothetical protein